MCGCEYFYIPVYTCITMYELGELHPHYYVTCARACTCRARLDYVAAASAPHRQLAAELEAFSSVADLPPCC